MSSTVRPDELSATLRRLRRGAQLSGIEAARAAGLSQPKISRLETGKQVPTATEVEVLCRVYRAPARTKQQLLAITDARDIAEYEACFATYEALAVYDADARQVFDRLSTEYRILDH